MWFMFSKEPFFTFWSVSQATLAALQQNAIANQQQLAALQQNVAQLQQLEQNILKQQQQQVRRLNLGFISIRFIHLS